MMGETEYKGLKKLRANREDKAPMYYCHNCRCKRYSPCGCIQRVKTGEG